MKKTKPTEEQALIASKLYVKENHTPFESMGYFSSYYIVVGSEDGNVYAEGLPTLEINTDAAARDFFSRKFNFDTERLVKVVVNSNNNQLEPELISFFP